MCTQTMSRDEQRYRLPAYACTKYAAMLVGLCLADGRVRHTVLSPPRSDPWGPRPTTAEPPGRAPTAEAPPSRNVVSGQQLVEHEVSSSGTPTPVATGGGLWGRREGLRQRPVPYLPTVAR